MTHSGILPIRRDIPAPRAVVLYSWLGSCDEPTGRPCPEAGRAGASKFDEAVEVAHDPMAAGQPWAASANQEPPAGGDQVAAGVEALQVVEPSPGV